MLPLCSMCKRPTNTNSPSHQAPLSAQVTFYQRHVPHILPTYRGRLMQIINCGATFSTSTISGGNGCRPLSAHVKATRRTSRSYPSESSSVHTANCANNNPPLQRQDSRLCNNWYKYKPRGLTLRVPMRPHRKIPMMTTMARQTPRTGVK